MKNHFCKRGSRGIVILLSILTCVLITIFCPSAFCQGRIAGEISSLKQKKVFTEAISPFSLSGMIADPVIVKVVPKFTLLVANEGVKKIISSKPDYLKLNIPLENGSRNMVVLLYKANISPGGFTLLTNTGTVSPNIEIVNYRGSIDNDPHSVASFSFSETETMGLISNDEGNFVLGRIENNRDLFMIYNDKDLVPKNPFECVTFDNPTDSKSTKGRGPSSNSLLDSDIAGNGTFASTSLFTTKCVNWYWETDYDLFVNKGSLANVNAYMQGVFNQVSTLYANDGISINLKTLFVWITSDPYTGSTTSNFLNQFGSYRTSWNGDLAHLIGFAGNGGIAYVNGLQMCEFGIGQGISQMGYSGISANYSSVPTYSWTVECIAHEQGHQLGSSHTHACVWNGNNTKIDDCGGYAGYSGGTCPQPNPVLPVGGGTIMSYCDLTYVGINFSKGFGPQPAALIIGKINASTCLTACNTCTVPAQPGTISGNGTACTNSSLTYSIAAISGATSYTWTLPTGWTGNSTTNTITVTAGTTGGSISVIANNSCGSSLTKSLPVAISAATPAQPGTISGNGNVCPNTPQTYSIPSVSGATSYTWTIPSGWSGSSTINSITVTTGSTTGSITVKANNGCGSSPVKLLNVLISSGVPALPGAISGNTNTCAGVQQTYSVASVTGATGYSWSLPSGWTGSSTGNSITVTTGNSGGTVSVTANNSCGSSTANSLPIVFSSVPATPGSITVSGGSVLVCSGDIRTYAVPLVSGVSYNWTTPTGATIISGQGSNSIVVSFSSSFSTSGTLSVKAVNSCSPSGARNLTISRNVPGVPAAIIVTGGIAKVCPGDSRIYSVTSVSGMTYQWTTPTGATISNGQGTNVVTVSFISSFITAGTLSVKAVNSCGSSSARTFMINKNSPGTPGSIAVSGGISKVCTGDTRTYNLSVITGITYNWVVPIGAIINSGQGSNSISVYYGTGFINSGTLSVTALNSCGTSGARSITISKNLPATPGSITGPTNICTGSITSYSISSVATADSYVWTVPVGAIIQGSNNTNSITILWGSTGGNITVKSSNGCGVSAIKSLMVYVNCPSPIITNAVMDQTPAIYPNPSEGMVNIRFYSEKSSMYNIILYDVRGRILRTESYIAITGINTRSYNWSSLANGLYFVSIQNKQGKKLLRFEMR